jgi:hypothetical protein
MAIASPGPLDFQIGCSEKHNVAEPNILAGGIAYQNWALIRD